MLMSHDFEKEKLCITVILISSVGTNKTNHPILSNNHPSATAHKAKHSLKRGGGVTKPTGASYNFDKV